MPLITKFCDGSYVWMRQRLRTNDLPPTARSDQRTHPIPTANTTRSYHDLTSYNKASSDSHIAIHILLFTHYQIMLHISWLHKTFVTDRYRRKPVLHGVDLHVPEWQIVGFLWPNGAGKTTTIQCIMWLTQATSGKITMDGKPIDRHTIKQIWYAADQTAYYDQLTGIEHCIFIAALWWISTKQARKLWNELLQRVWLDHASKQAVSNYSKGMKQRLGLALSLVHDPDLLIRDEPMSGLDPLGRELIKQLMLELQTTGKTIFFSTHILSDVQDICNSFTILHQGKTIFQDQTKNLTKPLDQLFVELIQQHSSHITIK